jgi:hypothetical protein
MNQRRHHYALHSMLGRKSADSAACLKNSVSIFVEKIYEMQSTGGGSTSILHTVLLVAY